jgi:signal transduction histidine kinase
VIQKNQLKVLLVEDNPDHAVLVKNAITKGKDGRYQVQLCASVEDAIEIMKSDHFNMVISDFNLAGKNGLQLLSWLNDQRIELPFIMVTGAGDEKIAVQAMQDGAYNYVVKDDVYLSVLPHVVDETFIKFLANQAQEQYEQEIRKKNIELEQANRNLKKLDQLKSDFVASVSHDVRSPLNSIQESIALILDGIVDVREEKGRRVLEISKRSTERLGKMIDDLLDFSKIEGGKMYLHIEPANIQVLIDEALGSLKSLADRKKVTYDFKPNDSFPTVPCDPERMIQVFTNLIGNAIKFTPAGGTCKDRADRRSRSDCCRRHRHRHQERGPTENLWPV